MRPATRCWSRWPPACGGSAPATVIGRLAGDEFVLIVPDVRDRAELARLAGDLARVITAPLPLGDRELFFGVNIGTALSSDTEPGPDVAANLLRAADTAMYRAKARGRNSIVAYDEGLRADVGRRVQISSWLNHALDRGEISVAYQPQFRCLDGRQVGVEALMRWRHPEAGDISPAEFIAIAEESGAILTIGAWVLTQACQQAAEWAPISGPDFSVAVNLSPHQLIDPGLLDIVRSALLRSRLPATALTLEVTEGALIDDPEAATEALARLRALGVRISLDDFGTGYSSLAYLAKFPVDELKVDRVFVRDIERDPRTRALAEGIVRIGHALGMRVLAEGVETPGQLRILTGAGCDFYQGFIAAPAETVQQATDRLRDRDAGPRHPRRRRTGRGPHDQLGVARRPQIARGGLLRLGAVVPTVCPMATRFAGFPADAFSFYADLELDNTKAFWADNKHRYETAVAGPLSALLDDLEARVRRRAAVPALPRRPVQRRQEPVQGAPGWLRRGGPGLRVLRAGQLRRADGRGGVVRVHRASRWRGTGLRSRPGSPSRPCARSSPR